MLPTLPNVKKFPDENMNLTSVLTLKGDDVFPLN